jgi:hypothetical protein
VLGTLLGSPLLPIVLVALSLALLVGLGMWAAKSIRRRSEGHGANVSELEARRKSAKAREAQDAAMDRTARNLDDRVDDLVRKKRDDDS